MADLSGVSIVICTHNGTSRLENTLSHALDQITSFQYEILVVDNASIDGTVEWVYDFAKKWDHQKLIRIVEESNPGLSSARRKGIAESKYSIILFCDDDNWLSSNYLEIGYRIFQEDKELGILGGNGIPVFGAIKPDWFDTFSHSYAVGNRGLKSGRLPYGSEVYGAGCFYRKSSLLELFEKGWTSLLSDRKGESLSSGGDVELCLAIQLLGFSIAFEEKLKFQHFLEEKRLMWPYYLELKKGICKSFPILASYKVREYRSEYKFKKYLFARILTVLKGILKTKLIPTNTSKREVDNLVVNSQLLALIKNYKTTLKGYRRNLSIFES